MPIITAQDIACQRGNFQLFKPVSFSLADGQSLLISGINGIGKTTLLESIAGLRNLQQGCFLFKGNDLTKFKDEWFENSFFIGHKTGNKKELNCLENLILFLQIQGVSISEPQAEEALERVGLAGYEYQLAGSLSAGQQKRLALARLLLVPFAVWVLDEPFVNLDVSGCHWLLNLLENHVKNNGILIITAHDNNAIKNNITHELILESSEL